MKKILLPYDTWGYYDFISEKEQTILLYWAKNNFHRLLPNPISPNRFFAARVNTFDNLPIEYNIIKQRIIEIDNIIPYKIDPSYGDFLSFNFEGGAIHKHIDSNQRGHIHTRYNLILSKPEQGGHPIYNDKKIPFEERFIWRTQAGKFYHESMPVIGKKPRVNISFGFSIPDIK